MDHGCAELWMESSLFSIGLPGELSRFAWRDGRVVSITIEGSPGNFHFLPLRSFPVRGSGDRNFLTAK